MGILSLGIVSPCPSGTWLWSLLACCASGCCPSGCQALPIMVNVPFWVFCLQGYHALGYYAPEHRASLSVVHPCASWVLDALPLGVTPGAVACLPRPHLPGYCASRSPQESHFWLLKFGCLGVPHLWVRCPWALHLWVLCLQVHHLWVLCLWVSHWLWCLAGHTATPDQCCCV